MAASRRCKANVGARATPRPCGEPVAAGMLACCSRHSRVLIPVPKNPGIYYRGKSYVVRWKDRGVPHKQFFSKLDLAREFKGSLDSGKTTRRPLASDTVADYYYGWLDSYRGRTSRGLEESSRREYEISFRLHILPLPIARMRMRDVGARDVRDWLGQLERRGCSPTTIRKAKAALAVMFASALQDGDLAANPVAGVRYVPSDKAKRAHPTRKRRKLTAADVTMILGAMEERWQLFFLVLVQTGVRVSELLGLTWRNVHLGDDPHIFVVEQVYKGERKRVKTEASIAKVPLSSTMAAWLAELRPADASPDAPAFPSAAGTPLVYSNVYHRVLLPALRASGIAVKLDVDDRGRETWDYQGIAFHAFRKACGSLLLAQGRTLKQIQAWLRHSQLTTTLNAYIHETDDGLGSADVWDGILGNGWGHHGATEAPERAEIGDGAPVAEASDLQAGHE
jgi:integrase